MKHRILPAFPALGLGLFLCGVGLAAANEPTAGAPADGTMPPPVTDIYHGVTVTDPYRWLENSNDPAVQNWSAAHDRRARAYLDALPYRKAIYDRLYQQLSASSASYYSIAVAGGRLFALSNQPPKNQPMLVMLGKDADPAHARIVVDPNALNAGGTTAIDWFVPSPDGRLLAVSMSENGSEDGSVHVFDADSGRQVYEVLPRVQYPTGGGSLAWRADSKGFWYTRYPGTERPDADRHFYMAVYFHELGKDPVGDAYVFGKGLPKIAEIVLDNRQNTRYVLATVQNGDGSEYAHYLIARDSHVTQLTTFADAVTAATIGPDDNIYLISQRQAPRGKLLAMPASAPVLAHARLLLPESAAVMQTLGRPIVVTAQAIYLREMLGGPGRVEILDHDGKRRGLLPLPDVATVDEVADLGDGTLLYSVETYLRPTYFCRYHEATGKSEETALAQTSPVNFNDVEVVREFATSKDGTRVPLNIVRRRDTALNGANPLLLYGYGGYHISEVPYFLGPTARLWLDAGGIFVLSNLRGGAEFGEDWHAQGALTHKQNVFDDFTAAARHLIERHYTAPEHLAIMGGSNGGLLMGAMLTQHPEMFRAVVSNVGIYDMLRTEREANGVFNITEYGSTQDPEQFRALYAYSPYHHVVDGTHYPAILMAIGEHDGRVAPWQSRKMIARLEAASPPGSPFYLSISSSSGHGFGSSLTVRTNQSADSYSFLFDQLGMRYPGTAAATGIMGFAPAHAAAEHSLEDKLQSLASPTQIREWHREFSASAHPAASPENNRLAEVVADTWRKQGWEDVTLRHYDVLHSSPRHVALEMVAPVKYQASLHEDAYDADPATHDVAASLSYFGYSASGDTTAELVYAHNGNPEDYELLRQHGVSVRGKIVIVRYSNPYSYRGFKALTAEREGAAALLIYSDPADDGYARGKVYPDGPWGPESHIQHGAITYDFIVPGDPLTPGWASLPEARRVAANEARSLPKLIALPLSWRDAKPLLANMNGAEVPPEWRGALPITYRFTGAVRVHVNVDMDTSIKPYTVVEARIRGSELPDEWVLIGNHRDAWVHGGVDPVSGTASMLELTRDLGELKRQGLRPRRTVIACSWDGEEYGLTGSTEWGEQFADDLSHKLVAYLNVDEAVSGAAATAGPEGLSFEPDSVASLAPMLIEASGAVTAPNGKSLRTAWEATWMRDHKAGTPPQAADLIETRIGSGSDHTVFLNHLGRPVMNMGFTGDYGVYHSTYDDHYWMTQVGDPTFAYHQALVRIWGVTALRLANADALPFDFGFYAASLRQFVKELEDRSQPTAAQLPLQSLYQHLADFGMAGDELRTLTAHDLEAGHVDALRLQKLNSQLQQVESNWLDPAGIPGRPWFKHLIYAARYTYAHLEYPGLTEAVEAGDWPRATEQAALVDAAVVRNTALLRAAASEWAGEGAATAP